MLVIYLASLALLLVTAFWQLNPLSSQIEQVWGLQNFQTLCADLGVSDDHASNGRDGRRRHAHRHRARVPDRVLRRPGRDASGPLRSAARGRAAAVVELPGPGVRLEGDHLGRTGRCNHSWECSGSITASRRCNWAVWITFSYLWLPFAILPIFGALERLPDSLLEASGDLGARNSTTFRRVVIPLVFPGIVAGVDLHVLAHAGRLHHADAGGQQALHRQRDLRHWSALASNLPLAAAFAMVPVAIMVIYLSVARKLGAFEAL